MIEARKLKEERKEIKADRAALRKDEMRGDVNSMKEPKPLRSRKECSDGVLRGSMFLFATPVIKGRARESRLLSETALSRGRGVWGVKERKSAELCMARAKGARPLCWRDGFCRVCRHGFFLVKVRFETSRLPEKAVRFTSFFLHPSELRGKADFLGGRRHNRR
jgi:hypothetical protein